jgi:hypothetical protein
MQKLPEEELRELLRAGSGPERIGKTITATALAKMFEDDFFLETLIICPKNLTMVWEDYAHRYQLHAKVLSITNVQNELPARDDQEACHASLNSTLFYLWFTANSDGRHVNTGDVGASPAGLASLTTESRGKLSHLSQQLEEASVRGMRHVRKSGLLIEGFDSASAKPILDEIDRVLARHYGFTDEELDFIINYDIKYRLGLGGAAAAVEDDGES